MLTWWKFQIILLIQIWSSSNFHKGMQNQVISFQLVKFGPSEHQNIHGLYDNIIPNHFENSYWYSTNINILWLSYRIFTLYISVQQYMLFFLLFIIILLKRFSKSRSNYNYWWAEHNRWTDINAWLRKNFGFFMLRRNLLSSVYRRADIFNNSWSWKVR